MSGRLVISDVWPTVDDDGVPAKGVVGEHIPVSATVWREGHDALRASLVFQGPQHTCAREQLMRPVDPGLDLWSATLVPTAVGMWTFRVDAWSDPWSTWRQTVEAKLAAALPSEEFAGDLETGARLLDRAAADAAEEVAGDVLLLAATYLRDDRLDLDARLSGALSGPVRATMADYPVRELVTTGPTRQLWVDRAAALTGAWYEIFPRSTGGWDAEGRPVHGTLRTATRALDRVAAMGFDVVYLPPIHPIGAVNRKGRNNSEHGEPGDVGSPWAIGSAAGGHDAIHPELGTEQDFAAFVARAMELGVEVALDLALQCAPDHPWVSEHPEWFVTRPDGTIAYAENPPKKYQDIYPLDFDRDPAGLYDEVLRVVRLWIDRGVRIFRVDNPHTKPPDFWAWLIATVKETTPDVLFLSEAFTRPARMYGLARLGFAQSYTYFTWRTSKRELEDFGRELLAHSHESRPNLFVNTPDILPTSLQGQSPAAFAIRAALAATLSPTWGVYSGFELYENHPVHPDSEEYLDSEKYQLRPRDFASALGEGRSLQPWLAQLNAVRRAHPALRQLRTLRFHEVYNDALIAYSKTDPGTGDLVIVVVNLDPDHPQEGTLLLDFAELDRAGGETFTAHDEVSGQTWTWGEVNYVRLDPVAAVAHLVTVRASERR